MGGQNGGNRESRLGSALLLLVVLVMAGALAAWKAGVAEGAAAASQPEPVEVVTEAVALDRSHQPTTTAIGTVLATRSVTLRNELPGTVRQVRLVPGQVVEAGAVLVGLDVSVEEAELRALEARAELAKTTLARYERMVERQAASAIERDNVRAERDIALAEIQRIRAIIERKTIRAPFRARVGLADVHPGQFLEAGTLLTTLQGVDEAVHVDFSVAQAVAGTLRPGQMVSVIAGNEAAPIPARVTAVDALVDPTTRNAAVRARIEESAETLQPGGSVRVRVPVGDAGTAVAVPVTAIRRGPGGDHLFVLESAENGLARARVRQVRTGPVVGEEMLVLEGLEAGERVAAAGSFKLREGVLVSTAGAGAAAESPVATGGGTAGGEG